MRSRAQQPILQILSESIIDGKSNDQRSHPGSDSSDRNPGDHADNGLAALCAEVASRDEQFEAHARSYQLSAVTSQPDSIITTPDFHRAPSLGTTAGTFRRYSRYSSP